VSDIPTPNGMAFSPDESVLYIANSGPTPEILAFDVTWGKQKKMTKKSKKSGAKKGKAEAPTAKRSASRKKKKKRQSLDELLQELDEDDEEGGGDDGVVAAAAAVNDEDAVVATTVRLSKGEEEEATPSSQDEMTTAAKKANKKGDVGPRVTLSNKRVFVDFTALSERCDKSAPPTSSALPYNGPDGLKVDALGNLYVAGACGVHVFRSNDGERVASLILPGVRVSNVAFAGDGHLYVTATDRVMRIRVGDTVLPALPERMILGDSAGDEEQDEENVGGYFW
jgi:DNA-binding beta-propeller fold protein YncE